MAIYAPVPSHSNISKTFYSTGYSIPITRMTLCAYSRIPYMVRCSALMTNTFTFTYYTKSHIWGLDAIAFRLNNFMGRKDNHLVYEATVADCSSATETISTMTFPDTPGSARTTGSSGSNSTPANTQAHVGQAYSTTFSMPSGIKLNQFDGSNWSN